MSSETQRLEVDAPPEVGRLTVAWRLDMQADRVFFSWEKGGRIVGREDYSMTGLAREMERRRHYGGLVPVAFHKALIALAGAHSVPTDVRH